MSFEQIIKKHYKNVDNFAYLVGLSADAIRKYLRGERRPSPDAMEKLKNGSNGRVTPNIIYEIPLKEKSKRHRSN